MNNKNNEKLEKVLAEALKLYEEGKTIPEILNLYPDYKEELQEMFQTIKVLMAAGENIAPPKELLANIISQIQDKEGVTNLKENRYLNRGIIKGRTSILQVLDIINILAKNMNKIYIGLGILVLVILVVGGIYWQSQRVAVLPIEKELTTEEESLNQDIAELEGVEKDTSLENLEQDLSELAEEKAVSETPTASMKRIETASIEKLENELAFELSGFSNDLSDLEGLESDTSLDNLDSGLSSVAE